MNKKEIEEQVIKMAKETGKIGINCNDFCGYPHLAAAGWEAPNEAALSNKKQIEEIQKTIGNVTVCNTTYAKVANPAFIHKIAEALYNAGYRLEATLTSDFIEMVQKHAVQKFVDELRNKCREVKGYEYSFANIAHLINQLLEE